MSLLRPSLTFFQSSATYALLLFGASVLAIVLTAQAMPAPLVKSEPSGE